MLLPACFAMIQARAARPGDPVVTIPIDLLGFQPIPPRFLVGGNSMFTLHFVDDTHLLFTFNSRGLLTRLPDPSPDDDDRNVTAVLLELPSGHVLARTTWRTRDREQYLWPLAHGRFLLRVRNRLTVIDPLNQLANGEPFRQTPFLDFKRRIGYISLSPGGDLLTVETAPAREPDRGPQLPTPSPNAQAAATAVAAAQTSGVAPAPALTAASSYTTPRVEIEVDPPNRPPVELHFYRLQLVEEPGHPQRLVATVAGILGSRSLLNVPATAEGFLDSVKESSGTWDFDFLSHSGKKLELSPYDTTCIPRPYFISRSEFIAFGCRGSSDKISFSGFNLRAEQSWIQVLSSQYLSPFLVTAPAAGRFAFSRILTSATFFDPENVVPEELLSQDILVMQNHDGRILLKVQATPIQRSAQNFDLSPDGLSFTVLRGGNIEVYRLPALSAKDQQELQLAQAAAPERNNAEIHLKSELLSHAAATQPSIPAAPPSRASGNATSQPPVVASPTAPAVPTSDLTDPVDIVNSLSFGTVRTPASAPAPTGAQPAAAPTPADLPPAPDPPRKPPTLFDPDHSKPPSAN